MKKEDLYYTAGLIDGEGTITLSKSHKNSHRAPVVSVSSTTPELLSYLKEIFGGHISKHKTYKEHHKPSWSWKLTYNHAYKFIEQLTPYLKEPDKKRRAQMILLNYKELTPRNGKYTSKMLAEKMKFEELFFQ